ncbi:MAG: ATP-grasp domain-containing protein [Leptospirales bacterium]|nr:ATP-grasp domain-containing protein [Leptospirales bacterium]
MFWNKKKLSKLYFVSVGAGINQIPLIREAKRCGFQVIAIDMNPAAPGFYYCDLKIQESIEDYESIFVKLSEMLVDGKISAIMTKSFGPAIITTAFLCEKFGFPFFPFLESLKFQDKKIIKKVFIKNDIAVPAAINITSKTNISGLKESVFPIIAKPVGGHAKTGIRLFKDQAELKKFISSHNLQNLIFEHFITGDEIICAGIVHEKKYYHILMSDKKTSPPPYFADILHTTPSKYQHLINKTTEIGEKIAEAFQIETSPMIMEFKIDSNENLYLLEAVPEFGGEFIPDVMIYAATGYNHIENSIRAASNNNFRLPVKVTVNNAVAVKYISGTDGILTSCSVDSVNKSKDIIFSRIFKHIGDKVSSLKTNHDRIGVIVAAGKTVEQAYERAVRAEENMNIKIKGSEKNIDNEKK